MYYQEISLAPKARIGMYDFWQKLFQQIHLALAENKIDDNGSRIGVSFPEYDAPKFLLGTKLRLFAKEALWLEELQCEKWLNRLSDYVSISQIYKVPDHVQGYRCFRQVKLKGSVEKLAKRRAKRHGESYEEALRHFAGYKAEQSRLPFIHMQSLSTNNTFKLFIEKTIAENPSDGVFSCYGLSNKTTVPIF